MKIAVIGTGAYSLAMTIMLSKNKNNNIILWSESEYKVKEFNETGRLNSILDIDLPNNINITTSYKEVIFDADVIFIMVAAGYLDDVSKEIKKYYNDKQHFVIASKGIEQDTCLFPDEIVSKYIKTKKIAVISGPSFAIDLANEEPVGLAIASKNKTTLNVVKEVLNTSTLKLRDTDDLLGIEICGSVKNVIAIAAGIIGGLGYSESSQVFLINEALHDMKYLIKSLGGNPKTIMSFAGVGDLLLTCTSKKSRNYSFGYVIGSTKSKEKINEYLSNNTVEGYYTLKSIQKLVKKRNVNIPIIDLIYSIVIDGENPDLLIDLLMSKE